MKGRDGCSDEGLGLETRVPVAWRGRRGGGRKAARREGSSWEGASCARHRCHTGTVVTGAGGSTEGTLNTWASGSHAWPLSHSLVHATDTHSFIH